MSFNPSSHRRAVTLLTAALIGAGVATTVAVAGGSTAQADDVCLPNVVCAPTGLPTGLPTDLPSGSPTGSPTALPTSPPTDLPTPPGLTLTATTPTSITGTPKVGQVVHAVAPTWDQSATDDYRWQRDGVDIAGAAAQDHLVVADDVGAELTVVASGRSDDGLAQGTSTSDPVVGTLGDAPTPARPGVLAVTGRALPGEVLGVVPGTWSGDPQPSFTYQWYRTTASGVRAVPGATAASYRVSTADAGRRLAALVRATRPGYVDGSALSRVESVPRTRPGVVVRLAHRTVLSGKHGVAEVVVRAVDGSHPVGVVVVRDGSRRLAARGLDAGSAGRLRITLPRLAPGAHRLLATYSGGPALAPSTSTPATLHVRRAHRH